MKTLIHTPDPEIEDKGKYRMKTHKDKIQSIKIEVCDACFQASCWQGVFMCYNSYSAGTVVKTIKELKEINTGEHPSWWHKSRVEK